MAARAATVVVRAASTLLADVPSSAALVAAILVTLPLQILGQHVQLPIEWQLRRRGDLVRAQACRVPTQRGIYLFSMIVDTPKVRSTCARCHEPLALLPLLSLCRPCPRPVLYCLLMHTATHSSLTRPLCAAFALRLRELGSREKKAKNEYVLLAVSTHSPYKIGSFWRLVRHEIGMIFVGFWPF